MRHIPGALPAIFSVVVCAAWTTARADNLPGLYVGAGVGYSTIRSDDPAYGLPGYFNDHQTAWKAIVGVRPLPIVGAEYEYIDFGHPANRSSYRASNYYGRDSHPRASALFGVGYLPIPVPFFDVYAKAGVARLQTDVRIANPAACGVASCPQIFASHDQTNNKFAYGMGLQSKLWGLSFRAEYERVSSRFGDPDALMIGATWTF